MIWCVAALAQQPPSFPEQEGYVPPAVDASGPRASRDGRWAFGTETGQAEEGRYTALVVSGATGAVRWRRPDDSSLDVLAFAGGATLMAGASSDRVVLGLRAPVWVATGPTWEGATGVLGDPTLDAVVEVAEGSIAGVGAVGHLGAPLGAHRRMLGARGWTGAVGVAGHLTPGRARLAADASWLAGPRVPIGTVTQDDAVLGNVSGGLGVAERLVLTAELLSRTELGARGFTTAEALLGVHHNGTSGWGWHLAVGRGITTSVGSPRFRAVGALRYRG